MNKILKGLLVTALAVSAAQVNAHTNKTFLMPRSHGVDLPMEYTVFNELIHRRDECKYGTNYQITGFYQASTNNKQTAKYFLFNDDDDVTLAFATFDTKVSDFNARYIIHDLNDENDGAKATVSLDPRQTSWGFRFDYHQDLKRLLKGLYLRASMPIVHVENNVRLSVDGDTKLAQIRDTNPTFADALTDFFAGRAIDDGTGRVDFGNNQAALTNAKINGKRTDTGIADIDVSLGYEFLCADNYHVSLALGVTIPAGNRSTGEYLFEAMVGNGRHYGIGADLNGDFRVWHDCEQNLKIDLMMRYRYLFEGEERRTLSIDNPAVFGEQPAGDKKWGQYLLLGKVGSDQLVPAANVTTLNLHVTPGSQFDGILGLAYNNCGFNLAVGYNLYAREQEKVKLNDTFDDKVYYIASPDFDSFACSGDDCPSDFTAEDANVADTSGATADARVANSAVNTSNLDLDSAETPGQLTHSIYAGLGYIFRDWDTPLMLGLGGKYEWPSKNSALEQWNIYGKIGVGF